MTSCWSPLKNLKIPKNHVVGKEKNSQDDKGGIRMQAWIECLKNPDTAELIETNLGLKHRAFKRGRKGKRRKENA